MIFKKATLALSIRAIVIVVLAMTLLGLGLGLVKGMFKGVGETVGTVQEQIKAQILDDLRTGNKPLSFPMTSLAIEKGKYKDVAVGVMNTKSAAPLNFTISLTTMKRQDSGLEPKDLVGTIGFFYESGPFTLQVTEAEVYPIRITATGDKGTYLVKISIMENAIPYAEKTFFVNVV